MSTDCEGDDLDSLLSLKLNDVEFDIPPMESMPPLETILWDMESEESIDRSENASLHSFQSAETKLHSVISHCILQGISSQISSAGKKVEAGMPTVITNSHKYITVGSSHGYIFNFNTDQDLCWCCHDSNEIDQGAISALAFNSECTRLLAGYERGHVLMLDATNGDVLRRLPDAHAPQSAVLQLRFTFMNNLALCGDSSGCVFSLTFNRRLGVRSWDSSCLFSGSKGEVCTFEPLINYGGYDLNFLTRNVIIAMASMSKMIIISLRPTIKCLFNQSLPCSSNFLPQISWQLVPFGRKSQHKHPVVAWGRGNIINFTRLVVTQSRNIKLTPLKTIEFEQNLISLKWLGSQNLSLVDTNENFHLFNVRTMKEIETVELENVEMVYNSAHFKALAVGGGVSEAFSLAGEKACYNSICSRGNDHLLILGTKAVYMIKLRSWPERLVYLSENGRWADALNLAADEGVNREQFTTFLLIKYLENLNQNVVDRDSLVAAINCCVKLNKTELLCNELWEAVVNDSFNQDWYFSLLTEHIINGKLTSLSPFISQRLISYLEKKTDLQTLENVLLTLEICCLDLHQVLTICKKSKLYNAWIHLTTKTIGDYASPLMEFLNTEPNSSLNQRLGNILLVYISSCLAGLGYPNGNIPKEDITRVKFDILRCLETQHSINCNENEGSFPYLRCLLKFNMRECLNVVELAFNEVEFSGEMGLLHRQRLVKILLEIVRPPDFNDSEEINLACFICRLLVSNRLNLDETALLNKIFETLMTKPSSSISLRDHLEREQVWLDLIISTEHLNELSLEIQLEKANLSNSYKIIEYLSEQSKEFNEIFKCYLKDTLRKTDIFSYINRYIGDDKRKIRQQFFENFQQILAINCEKTVEIITENYINFIEEFYEKICNESDQLKYDFLKEVLSNDVNLSENLAKEYLELICAKNETNEVLEFLKLCYIPDKTALEITQKYNIFPAVALLHEKNGEWNTALDVLLENKLFESALELCVRASEHLDVETAQKLWKLFLKNGENHGNNGVLLRSLTALHVPPDVLIELISNVNFGDVRTTLERILMEHSQELEMHSATLKLLSKDIHKSLAQTLSKNGKGVFFNNICSTCHESLLFTRNTDGNTEFFNSSLVWGCGHSFHEKCVNEFDNIKPNMCPICKIIVKPSNVNRPLNNVNSNWMNINTRIRPDLEGHF